MFSYPFRRDGFLLTNVRIVTAVAGLGICVFAAWGLVIAMEPPRHWSMLVTIVITLFAGLLVTFRGITGTGAIIEGMRERKEELERRADYLCAHIASPRACTVESLKEDLNRAVSEMETRPRQ